MRERELESQYAAAMQEWKEDADVWAAERNELRIASWKEQVAQELGKKVSQGANLVYLDAVGFSLKGVLRRTWWTKGVTPLVMECPPETGR